MAIIVQPDNGDLLANSYIDTDYLKQYCVDRNIDMSEKTDIELEALLFEAMDYIELRTPSYIGSKVEDLQLLQWPRKNTGGKDYLIPKAIKTAQAVLALEARTHTLMKTRTPQDMGAQTSNAISGAITKQYAQVKDAVSKIVFTKAEALLRPLTKPTALRIVRA